MFGSLKEIGLKRATVRWRGGLGCGGNNRLPSRSFLAPFVFTGNLPKLRGAATAAALLSSWSMPIDLLLCVYYQSGKFKQCLTHFSLLIISFHTFEPTLQFHTVGLYATFEGSGEEYFNLWKGNCFIGCVFFMFSWQNFFCACSKKLTNMVIV